MATLSTVTDPTNQTTSSTPATLTRLTTPTTKTNLSTLLTTLTDLARPPYNVWKQWSGVTSCKRLSQFAKKIVWKDFLCKSWPEGQFAKVSAKLSRMTTCKFCKQFVWTNETRKETTKCAHQPLGGRQQCSIFQEPLLSPPSLITRQAHCNNLWKT